MKHATDQDWDTEYLALTMGVKVVDSLDEAIDSINMHSTGHTESIISEDYSAIETFAKRIDSAVVMVNAVHPFHRRRGVRLRRGARHLHAEDARPRPDGTQRDDHHEVDRLRNGAGTSMSEERTVISTIRDDIDLNDQALGLKIAAERLSIVATCSWCRSRMASPRQQRASLEYADAVLIGWPETDSPEAWNWTRRS